jgi:alpha/beta superfamily hydrolase
MLFIYRVLTVHGSMDKVVPVDDAMEFAKLISNHKLHIIEGADHEYTKHQDELASVVLNFVRDGDMSEQLLLQTRIRSIHSRL